jgi:hypothetical protein
VLSHHFQTGAITSLTRNLGSSFATAFDVQYYDPQTNTIKELRFSPEILSETFQQPVSAPAITEWGTIGLLVFLGTGAVYSIKRRNPRLIK